MFNFDCLYCHIIRSQASHQHHFFNYSHTAADFQFILHDLQQWSVILSGSLDAKWCKRGQKDFIHPN